nr:hypothetical protein [Tanacetum cinerariifolium]
MTMSAKSYKEKVPAMLKVDKNKAKRTKPSTRMERVQEIEAEESHDVRNEDFDMLAWQSQGQSLANHAWRTINDQDQRRGGQTRIDGLD